MSQQGLAVQRTIGHRRLIEAQLRESEVLLSSFRLNHISIVTTENANCKVVFMVHNPSHEVVIRHLYTRCTSEFI